MRILHLPWPLSTNRYWRHPKPGQHLVSAAGRDYRRSVHGAAMQQPGRRYHRERLRVGIVACAPDRRRRDLDNLLKARLDALAYAGVYEDDAQIDEIPLVRGDVLAAGQLVVTVQPLETT